MKNLKDVQASQGDSEAAFVQPWILVQAEQWEVTADSLPNSSWAEDNYTNDIAALLASY